MFSAGGVVCFTTIVWKVSLGTVLQGIQAPAGISTPFGVHSGRERILPAARLDGKQARAENPAHLRVSYKFPAELTIWLPSHLQD